MRSLVIHEMNERYAYKLDEHKYVIKVKVLRDSFRSITLCYTEKYFRERNVPGNTTFEVAMEKVSSTSYFDYYEAVISDLISLNGNLIPALAIRYFFKLENDEIFYYGNYKYFNDYIYDTIHMFNLVVVQLDDTYFKVPEWSNGAVIYQIFPERFYPPDGNYSDNFFTVPMSHFTRTNGSLDGIRQKIDYLKELGVDSIYLNPIFLSSTNHRYDTIDYLVVDPLLGGETAFKNLVEELHKEGLKIIIDLVFNHTSTNFFAFRDIIINQEKSKYVDWYYINKFPVRTDELGIYKGFSFSPYMPKLNVNNPDVKEYLLKVTRLYLEEFKVDGYRLDVADEVNHSFWKEFRKVCKEINPNCLIMGEIWYESYPYLRGDEFDSIMNYSIFDAIRGVLINRYDIQEFIDFIERERGESNLTFLHASNILIGSHDTDRIFTSLGQDENKYLSAMILLLFIPGSPIIYYGDEKMMEGGFDPDCRRGMIFDEDYHKKQFEVIKRLIKLKHLDVFKTGDIRIINQGDYIEMIRFNDSDEYHLYFTNYHDVYIHSLEYEYDLVREEQSDGHLKQYHAIITKKDRN